MNTTTERSVEPRLLVRWFVHYNPLFTLSALCVLGGVLLLSRHLQRSADDVSAGLSVVVELYQWVLIGSAGLLYRRLNEHRPGVILGVIALVFLADPTLQLSALASSSHVGACVLWVVLVAAKLHALQFAFCLQLSLSARVLPVLGAAVVAVLPNARLFEDVADDVPVFLAVGIFVLGVIASLAPLRVTSSRALGEVGLEMFPRLMQAAAVIGVVGALYQGGNAVFALGGAAALPMVGAVVLVGLMQVPRSLEWLLWGALGLSGIWFAGAHLEQLGCVLAAVSLLIAARHNAPRVLTAGLVVAAMPSLLIQRHDLLQAPTLHIMVALLLTTALIAVLIKRRAPSALVALVAVHHRTVLLVVVPSLNAQYTGTWGVVLVGAGFVMLPLGVYAHRRLSTSLALDDALLALDDVAAPTTSTSVGIHFNAR